ncbi:MAG: adenylate/guanylate cyclase domain-containing protein, partial [Alphaproteobacteria bacterium]|nr:adenylate/guanylate cyclase domain-containing protein [Alphaproteobacteria bacterium]
HPALQVAGIATPASMPTAWRQDNVVGAFLCPDEHIASMPGDDMVFYMCLPHAHEQGTRHAIRDGLDIINSVTALNGRMKGNAPVSLSLRLSDTCLEVSGEVGDARSPKAAAMPAPWTNRGHLPVEPKVKQQLAAILAADVAGYSRLMGDDERATIATITEYRGIYRECVEANGGRVVDMAGDSVLAVFPSACGAVRAAVEAQAVLTERNEALPESRQMHFRAGVNLGDIYEHMDGTVFGDAVNIAARLEGLAEAGGVMISEFAYQQVRRNPDMTFADAGTHHVKNIAEPVVAYRVCAPEKDVVEPFPLAPSELRNAAPRRSLAAAVSGVMVVVAGLSAWQFLGFSTATAEAPVRIVAAAPSHEPSADREHLANDPGAKMATARLDVPRADSRQGAGWEIVEETSLSGLVSGTVRRGSVLETMSGSTYEVTDFSVQFALEIQPQVTVLHNGESYKLLVEGIDEPLICRKLV